MFKSFEDEICDSVSSNASTIPSVNDIATYFRVVQNNPTIIVIIKNPRQTSNTTKREMLKNIDPIKENLTLEQVKNISNGAIAIRHQNNEKFAELLNVIINKNYDVKFVHQVKPRIRISGLSGTLEYSKLIRI